MFLQALQPRAVIDVWIVRIHSKVEKLIQRGLSAHHTQSPFISVYKKSYRIHILLDSLAHILLHIQQSNQRSFIIQLRIFNHDFKQIV